MVTVAWRCSSSSAIGLPTMSLRPMTTARVPLDRDAGAVEQLDDARRRARHQARPVLHEQADVDRGEAVDVLGRVDRVDDAGLGVVAHARRQRRLHEDAVDVVAARSAPPPWPARRRRAPSAGTRISSARMPVSPAVLSLLRT